MIFTNGVRVRAVVSGLCFGLLTVFGVLQLSACGKKELTDAQYVEQAKDYQDQGKLRAAVIELKNALRANPDNTEARWLLGNLYLSLNQGAAAEKELQRAKELGVDPAAVAVPLVRAWLMQGDAARVLKDSAGLTVAPNDRVWLYSLRGRAYLAQGQLEQAEAEFGQALQLKDDFSDAQLGQALLALARGDTEGGRAWIDKVLAADGKSNEAWSLLGDLEQAAGQPEAAEAAYTKAIESGAASDSDYYKRALLRVSMDKLDGARKDVEGIRAIVPNHPAARYLEGLISFKAKQYPEAQTAFEQVLQANQNYMPALFFLGATHFSQGNLEQAEQHLRRVVNAFPNAIDARLMLGATLLRRGDPAGAEGMIKPVVDAVPDNVQALSLLGVAAVRQGKTEEGVAYLSKVSALDPQSAATRMQLGMSLVLGGKATQGIQELKAAVDLDPEFRQADLLIALTYLQQRDFNAALEVAERWRTKDSKDPMPLNLTGLVHLGQAQPDQARAAFTEALKLAPGDHTAAYNLANMALKDEKPDEARAYYEAVLKVQPGHLQTLLKLADMEGRLGREKAFIARLQEAQKANPDALEPRLLQARYQLQFGQPSEALRLMQEVRENYPKHGDLLGTIGEAQLALDQNTEAVATLSSLVAAHPRSAASHFLLAKAYAAQGDASRAREQLNETLKLDPDHALAKVAMTRLLVMENKTDQAVKLLAELKKTYPNHPEVLAQEGWVAMSRGRPAEAVTAYKAAQKLAPNRKWAISLALAQWQANDQQGGYATLEDWLKQHPDDWLVRYNLANGYLLGKRDKEAIAALEKVAEQAPDYVPALNSLAWQLRGSDKQKAWRYAERALKLLPEHPVVMDTAGMVLLERGEGKRAADLLRRAADLAPRDPAIQYHSALAAARNGDKAQAIKTLEGLLANEAPFAEKAEAAALLDSLKKGQAGG